MSKAATLLKKISSKQSDKRQKKEDRLVVPPGTEVVIPSYDRPTTVRAAARLFKIVSKKVKSFQTELDVIKSVIRETGADALNEQFAAGRYFASADCGGVKVSRANKFSALDIDRNELQAAVGEAYGAMFKEEAVIAFNGADELQAHLRLCEETRIPVGGKASVTIKGRPGMRERMCDMWDGLGEDKRELLTACAKDQAARVGG